MALSLLFTGSPRYRLMNGDRAVGWLTGDSLVFGGFSSLADAERAGDAGYIALLDWLQSRQRMARQQTTTLHVAVGEDHLSEWLGPNGHVLARIIRPVEDDSFVVEFTLPSHIPTVAAAEAASRIYDAMRACGYENGAELGSAAGAAHRDECLRPIVGR